MLFGIQCTWCVHHENSSQRCPRRFQTFGTIEGVLLRVQLSGIESTLPKQTGNYYTVLHELRNHWESWRKTLCWVSRKHFQIYATELGHGRCCLCHTQKLYYRIRTMSSWLLVPEWYLSFCQESAKGRNYLWNQEVTAVGVWSRTRLPLPSAIPATWQHGSSSPCFFPEMNQCPN